MINKKRIVLIICFVFLFLFSVFLFNSRFGNKTLNKNKEVSKINLLNDYSRFFTVNSCIYKYISYLQSKDIDSLMKVLDVNYIMNNNINSNNIFDNLGRLDGNYSFITKKVYYEKISDTYFKYYVYGQLKKDIIDENNEKIDKYYIVNIDNDKGVFNIFPYEGDIFKEELNE